MEWRERGLRALVFEFKTFRDTAGLPIRWWRKRAFLGALLRLTSIDVLKVRLIRFTRKVTANRLVLVGFYVGLADKNRINQGTQPKTNKKKLIACSWKS